jgi:hypothetical protein
MVHGIGTVGVRRVDAAVGVHHDVVRVYEQAFNSHTFDFEEDVGPFLDPDITIAAGGELGGRLWLLEASQARADYARDRDAAVSINVDARCVADLDTAVVLVTEGDFIFTYPDRSISRLRVLASSTLRHSDGRWVFQHVHLGKGCCL